MTDNKFDAEVGILGYGPSGVVAANRLGALGISAIAFEREPDIYQRARAVTVSDWTCRYFQAMGLDTPIKETMDQTYLLRWITYAGEELYRLEFPKSDMGHARSYAIYQPEMEQVLRDGVDRYSDLIEVRCGSEVINVEQDESGVTVTSRICSNGEICKHRFKYLLGCYGGNAKTRELIGVELAGSTAPIRWIVIDAKVKRWWPNRNMLTFWSDKQRPVVDIALANGNHRWELPLSATEKDEDFRTEEDLWQLLRPLGVTPEDITIHQHAFYNHHVRMADNWRIGRVLLLGDAAHLMPPWAGAGMQSGIRDAFCLSWLLALVLKGKLDASVLDCYQLERQPDVERYTQVAVQLGRIIQQQVTAEEMAGIQAAAASGELPPLLQAPELHAGWLSGKSDDNTAVGAIIPQPRIARSDGRLVLLDDVLRDDIVLLGNDCDPVEYLSDAQRSAWDRLGARYIAVRPISGRSASPDDVVDLEGILFDWMNDHGVKVIAVRPDRFVAASDRGGLNVPTGSSHAD